VVNFVKPKPNRKCKTKPKTELKSFLPTTHPYSVVGAAIHNVSYSYS